jgi:hypothetical protein
MKANGHKVVITKDGSYLVPGCREAGRSESALSRSGEERTQP